MKHTIDSAYRPELFEDDIYKLWEKSGRFAPQENADSEKQPFVIMMPPPNVTGILHMGHGLNNALPDILVRLYRMAGHPVLWLPGTDHAGIATQNVVEKKLKARGLSRKDFTREGFLEEVRKVKEEHHAVIRKQLKKLGVSCDWNRERFTLDPGLSRAVKEVFVRLYEEDFLYKGQYLVNWCFTCGTALADDEVEHKESRGALYHVRYPFADPSPGESRPYIEIATTRPETIPGDSAVAVHPQDPRYKDHIGRLLLHPLTGKKIPLIGDEFCDPDFGTGAVKITPAHDPNDREVSLRHPEIETLNTFTKDGKLNNSVPPAYQGLPLKEASDQIVKDLKASGALTDIKDHRHSKRHCYRCHSASDFFLSTQWFVRMKSPAKQALESLRREEIRFFPRKWENTYTNWLDNIHDWCISRQLWWGHRIPAYTCTGCRKLLVQRIAPERCPDCGGTELLQDPDVLDTWFSSWLWPFSTLGWPEQTPDLRRFYPGSTLITGYDIIFFWVARMVMAGRHFTGQAPFRDIYLTPMVRDKQGRKMSKSLGNGIDPLKVIEEYGADALKFTVAYLSTQGQDILLDKDIFKIGGRFCNKIWNASRFVLMNLEEHSGSAASQEPPALSLIDHRILGRLNTTIREINKNLQSYRFDEMAHAVYRFFRNDLCDWYLEWIKPGLYGPDLREKNRILANLETLWEEVLRLLHPFVPFLTEQIYQSFRSRGYFPAQTDKTEAAPLLLMTRPYPQEQAQRETPEARENGELFSLFQDIIQTVRNLRSEYSVPPGKNITATLQTAPEINRKLTRLFTAVPAEETAFKTLAKLETLRRITAEDPAPPQTLGNGGKNFEVFLHTEGLIQVEKEIPRLEKTIRKLKKQEDIVSAKLRNETFLEKAPPAVLQKEKEKQEEFRTLREQKEASLKRLQNLYPRR